MKLIREDKYFYKISEASKIVGVKQSVLRYWEKEFNLNLKKKSKKSHRRYTREDIEKFLKIKYLLYEKKIKIAKAKEILSNHSKRFTSSDLVYELKEVLRILKSVGA